MPRKSVNKFLTKFRVYGILTTIIPCIVTPVHGQEYGKLFPAPDAERQQLESHLNARLGELQQQTRQIERRLETLNMS